MFPNFVTHFTTKGYLFFIYFNVCSQQQGAPKVEKVFFTTAIPMGGHAGKFECFIKIFLVPDSRNLNVICHYIELS